MKLLISVEIFTDGDKLGESDITINVKDNLTYEEIDEMLSLITDHLNSYNQT